MFKYVLVMATALGTGAAGHTQVQQKSTHLKVYKAALQANDYSSAAIALQYLIADNPASPYKDTLAYLYYAGHKPEAALYWIEQGLKTQPAKQSLLELKVECLDMAKDTTGLVRVLGQLHQLYPNNPVYLWKLADAQVALRRDTAALTTLKLLEALPPDADRRVPYVVAGLQATQFTTIHAAAANLKGMILYSRGFTEAAKAAFNQALGYDKNYQLPQLNLATLLVPGQKQG